MYINMVRDFRNSTSSITRSIELTVTRPTIEISSDAPVIPMNDPNGVFDNWIEQHIMVKDVRGERLSFTSDPSNTDPFPRGYFYFDPLPNLFPGFTVPDEQTTTFDVVAVDWRGVEERREDLSVTVRATGATITLVSDALEFELSDTALSLLDHNITAKDEFDTDIVDENITLSSVSPGNYDVGARLDSLVKQDYIFTYQITDFRGVMVEQTRNVSIRVTPPTLNVEDFESANNIYPTGSPHPVNTLEYKDPWSEVLPWLQSANAQDLYNQSHTDKISLYIEGVEDEDFSTVAPDLSDGDYNFTFEVIDTRYQSLAGTDVSWLEDLTTRKSLSLI